jgi:hypothetical protein
VLTSGFDYFSWRAEAGVLVVMGGGMSYHLLHDGGASLWFVFPAAATIRIGCWRSRDRLRANSGSGVVHDLCLRILEVGGP